MGTRVWGQAAAWDYDTEGIFQFGDFGSGDIRAWSVASNTGYTLASLWGQPRLGLQADFASGGGPGKDTQDFLSSVPEIRVFHGGLDQCSHQFHRCLPLGYRSAIEELRLQSWR
jgi:hypothetical protein